MEFTSPTEARIILRNLKEQPVGSQDAAQLKNLLRVAGIYFPQGEVLAYENHSLLLLEDEHGSSLKRELLKHHVRELGYPRSILVYNKKPYALDMDLKTKEAGVPLVAIVHAQQSSTKSAIDACKERLCFAAFPDYRATYRRDLLADLERVAFLDVQYRSSADAAAQLMTQYLKPRRYRKA